MSRIATARKLANEIWFNTEAMTDRAAWEAFTTTQSIGYPLAQAIVKGWVTGISTEGVTQLCETARDLRDLRNLLALAALPQVDVTSEEVKPVQLNRDGITWTLRIKTESDPSLPVTIGEALTDSTGDRFIVTGAAFSDLISEIEPSLVGHWEWETDPKGGYATSHLLFGDVRWTWLAND